MSRLLHGNRARILIADTNTSFREALSQHLRASGFEVVTASTGQSAFALLRDWNRPVDWLYARADLQDLVDGWILADEFRDSHPHRAAVIASSSERVSGQGHVVLKEPPLEAALGAIATVTAAHKPAKFVDEIHPDPQRAAA